MLRYSNRKLMTCSYLAIPEATKCGHVVHLIRDSWGVCERTRAKCRSFALFEFVVIGARRPGKRENVLLT